MDDRPICLFDSGIGGITVLDEFISRFPNQRYIYIADEKSRPYGNREDGFIISRITKIAEFMLNFNPKVVVIACNTASRFRSVFEKFFDKKIVVDVISPTVNYVTDILFAKTVLLLATESTVKGGLYQKTFQKRNILCDCVSCGEFVNYIENVERDDIKFFRCIENKLGGFLNRHYDVVIYGCTHYGFADYLLRGFFPLTCNLLSCGVPTALLLKELLSPEFASIKQKTLLSGVQYFTTSDEHSFESTLTFYDKFYGDVSHVEI